MHAALILIRFDLVEGSAPAGWVKHGTYDSENLLDPVLSRWS